MNGCLKGLKERISTSLARATVDLARTAMRGVEGIGLNDNNGVLGTADTWSSTKWLGSGCFFLFLISACIINNMTCPPLSGQSPEFLWRLITDCLA